MLQTVKKAIEELIVNGYAVIQDNRLILTERVLEIDMTAIEAKPAKANRSVSLLNPKTKSVIPAAGEQSLLIKFIIDCEIPQKARLSTGNTYWVTKYSKAGEIELAKIIDQGYQLDILKAATKLYYKAGGAIETISNFLIGGTWLTHYNEMAKQLEAGTADKHIRSNLNDQVSGGALSNDR